MKRIYFIICLVFAFSASNQLEAYSILGAEISYKYAVADSFDITLKVYRDCNGIAIANTPIKITTTCTTYTKTLTEISVRDITGIYQNCSVLSKCSGGTYPYGFEEHTYQGRIRMGGDTCCKYTLSWEQTARSAAITTGAANTNFFIEAVYYKCLAPTNSSPEFITTPKILIPNGKDANLTHHAADNVDGDMVTFSMTEVLTSPGTFTTWPLNWTYDRPFTFLGFPNASLGMPAGIHFDTAKGILSFRPAKLNEVSTYAVKAQEWRTIGGVKTLIGETTREILGIIINGSNISNPPKINNISVGGGGGNGNISSGDIIICNGTGPYCADITIEPNDSTVDTLYFNYKHNLTNITFNNIGTVQKPVIRVCYSPTASEISSGRPLEFLMEVNDNECPLPSTIEKIFTFKTAGPMPDSFAINKSLNCRDLTLTANNMSSLTGFSYSWEILSPDSTAPYTITGASFTRTLDSGWHKVKLNIKHQNPNQYCDFRIYTDSVYIDPSRHIGVSAGPDVTLCFNPVTTITPSVSKGTSPFTYLWDDSTITSVRVYTAPMGKNTVWVKVTDANNCVAIDSADISYYHPKVVLTGDTAQCIRQNITLTAQLSDTNSTPVFGWTGFSNNMPTINPVLVATTQYDFTLADGSGCVVNTSYLVKAYDPQVSASHPSAVCVGDSIQFIATTGGGLAPYTVSWAPFGLNGSSLKIGTSSAGIVNYTATVTDAFGCKNDETGFVTVNALPSVTTVSPGGICQSVNTLNLNTYGTPSGGVWSGTGVSGNSLNTTISDTGLINLDYVYTNSTTGCKNSASTWVYVELQPVASFTADSLTGPVTHNFSFSNSSIKASYNSVTWDFGDPASGAANFATTLDAQHTFSDSGTYTIKLILSAVECDPDTETKVIKVYRKSGPNSIRAAGVANAKVYPNPASDLITVEGDDLENIRIVDVQGREMNIGGLEIAGNQCMINVKSLATGLYFVEITDIYHRVSQVKIAVQR